MPFRPRYSCPEGFMFSNTKQESVLLTLVEGSEPNTTFLGECVMKSEFVIINEKF